VRLPKPVTAQEQARVGQQVPGWHPVRDQLRREAGKQLLQGLLSAGKQPVDMAPLWNATPVGARLGQLVPIDDCHLRVGVGEHSGGEQPRQASAEHHRTFSGLLPHRSLLLDAGRLRPDDARSPDRTLFRTAQWCSVTP
jgi:hypothetical protein